ncbi:MAG: Tol-Pal system beta propeller repeat protein TolB [Geminicoccaceae bacterium]
MVLRRVKSSLAFLMLALAVDVGWPTEGSGQLRVRIEEGTLSPVPIAVSPLFGADTDTSDLGGRISQVASADLDRSGLFTTINPAAYIQAPEALQERPRFADWRQINAEVLVAGKVERLSGGQIAVEVRIWDVFGGAYMDGARFVAPEALWRRIAHKMADKIYERLTGERGYFDSRIVYVSETGPKVQRVKRLAVMDQDGANHRFLTNGNELVLTPQVDRASDRVAYLAYRGIPPQVYIHQLNNGRESLLGSFEGMTFSPRFSPDGRSLALTLATGGNSDLYIYDLASRSQRQITNHPAIDTSPSFSPDGRQIVFNSDRGGRPLLYVMNTDGGPAKRISFGEGQYGSPAWSPRGDLIAFTVLKNNAFHIGVMEPDGSNERLLTRSYLDDGPRWSPNGRVIIFSRTDPQNDRTRLFTIDITGYNLREVPTPLDASDPDWTALIP